jgi:hypothetical protein
MTDIVIDKNVMLIYFTPPDHPWHNFCNTRTHRGFFGIEVALLDYNAIGQWDLLDADDVPYHKITFASDADLTFFLLRFSI